MTARDYIPLKILLAASLCQLTDAEGNPLIPYDHAKLMTPDQVLSLFQRDHYPIRKIDGGPDIHWNIVFRFIPAHRLKTAKIDQPQIAKTDRLVQQQEEFRRKVLQRECGQKRERRGTIPSRGFQKRPKKSARNRAD